MLFSLHYQVDILISESTCQGCISDPLIGQSHVKKSSKRTDEDVLMLNED